MLRFNKLFLSSLSRLQITFYYAETVNHEWNGNGLF